MTEIKIRRLMTYIPGIAFVLVAWKFSNMYVIADRCALKYAIMYQPAIFE